MQIFCLQDLDELAPYADDWDRLAGHVPFRGWNWLSTWWRHYGSPNRTGDASTQLFVPCAFDCNGTLVGLAPWYSRDGGRQGRVIRSLGSGDVASDYLGVLSHPAMEQQVADALADFLSESGRTENLPYPQWDLLELNTFDAADRVIRQLLKRLANSGHAIHSRPGPNCWRIELPTTWDEYLGMLSKSHRKQVRRLQRNVLSSGRAVLHTVDRIDELPRTMDLLIDLHQRRRRALGEPGCFASVRFAAFHREVVRNLSHSGELQLSWLELDGKPAAAEYHLAAGGVIYAYQAGIDPSMLSEQPGRLITLATLQRAIEQGYRAFDFLRGDEPYKAHFRAAPHATRTVRVVPHRTAARMRHGLWLAGSNVKQWIKGNLTLTGMRED